MLKRIHQRKNRRIRSTTNQNIVGAQIRKLRYGQEMTQDNLAARCGRLGWDISRGTLAKVEAGVRCVSDKELLVLAKSLGANVNELYPTTHKSSKR